MLFSVKEKPPLIKVNKDTIQETSAWLINPWLINHMPLSLVKTNNWLDLSIALLKPLQGQSIFFASVPVKAP